MSMVLLHHFWVDLFGYTGRYAVFAFYLLSGFLNTTGLMRKYSKTCRGSVAFLLTRFQRVYGPYWIALIVTGVCLKFFFEGNVSPVHRAIQLPHNALDWCRNILLIDFVGADTRLIPPAWFLSRLLALYFIAIFVARSRTITWLWFIGSLGWTFYQLYRGVEWAERYFPLSAACLPFSFGAVLAHEIPNNRKIFLNYRLGMVYVVTIGTVVFFSSFSFLKFRLASTVGFYSFVLANGVIIAALQNVKLRKSSSFVASFDLWCGRIAYPLFLYHWLVASFLVESGITRVGTQGRLFLVGYPISVLVAFFMARIVEMPFEHMRSNITAKMVQKLEI